MKPSDLSARLIPIPRNAHPGGHYRVRPSQNCLLPRFWLALLFLVGCWNGVAQVALRNAVITDQGIQSRRRASEAALQDQPGGEAGPVRFSVGFSYSIGFSDNVNYSENDPTSDFIQTPAVGLGLGLPITERSSLGLQVGVGYQVYWHNEDLSRWQITPDSELAYDLQIKDAFITVFNRFSYTQDVYSQPGVANQATFPQFQNTAGTQVTWIPNDYVIAGGYSYQLVRSGSGQNNYINRGSHLLFGRLGHLYAEGAINTGLEISATFTDYQQSINSDTTVLSLGPYFEWAASDTLDLSLRGGYAFYTFTTVLTPDQSTDENSFYLGLSGDQQLTDYIGHRLSVTHGVGPGVEQGTAFLVQTSVGYSISYNFIDPATLRLGLDYTHGEEQQSLGGDGEIFDQWRFGAGIGWTVTTRVVLTLAYDLTVRDSNQPDRAYTRNQVTLGGTYTF